MRPAVKDSIGLRSFFAEGSFRYGRFGSSAIRVAFDSVIAATATLLLGSAIQLSSSLQLPAAASAAVLAFAVADRVVSRRAVHHPLRTPPDRQDLRPEPETSEDPSEPLLACPAGHPECWALDTVHGILRTDDGVSDGLEVGQATAALARQACELVQADAAWVFRLDEVGESAVPVASYIHPGTARDSEGPSAGAHRIAEEAVRSIGKGGIWERRHHRASAVEDYVVAPLIRRSRVLGVLVVRCSNTEGMSHPLKKELIALLAGRATLTLENSLLYESQMDVEARLRQFRLHRSDYAATLSHELRTPLTSIKGFAQLLTRDQESSIETVREYASTIAAEADKLALIVNDIVDLTRMESGLLQLRRRPVALGRLIQGVVTEVQPMALNQRLEANLPERMPLVRVDPERLEQVLGRLLVDAIGQGEPDGAILLAAESGEEGVTVRLEYRATDAQIDGLIQALKGPAQLTGDGQATQLGRGRLGLYICRNFIEAHGGKMWIEQPEDQLVRVVFTLPY